MSMRDFPTAKNVVIERRGNYARLSTVEDADEDKIEAVPFLDSQLGSVNDSDYESVCTPREPGYGVGWCYKIVILFCISFLAFGSYFIYDSVSALEGDLTTELSLNKSLYGLFFSIYAIPNIVLVIGGGVLIDRIGNRKSAMLFGFLIVLGAVVFALAPTLNRFFNLDPFFVFIVMLVGRFIYGIGAESSYVVQNSMCVEWFQGKHLAKAMGMTNTVAHLGSVFAFNTEAAIADYMGDYIWALWFAAITAVLSLLATLIYVIMDKRAKKNSRVEHEAHTQMITLKDIRNFQPRYWICAVIAVCIYCDVYAFRSLASAYISQKWGVDDDAANFFVSVIDITALIASPFFGLLVDWTGLNGWLVTLGNLFGVTGFMLLGLTMVHPLVGILCIGVHYCFMAAALSPCVSILVDEKFEGTAYSFVSAFVNLGGAGVFPLAGWIADNHGFTWLCLFFAGLASIASVLSIVWNLMDVMHEEPVLNKKKE